MTKAVFFSKKSKAKMRARRHKLMKASSGGSRSDDAINANGSGDRRAEHASSDGDGDGDGEPIERTNGRKRAADRISHPDGDRGERNGRDDDEPATKSSTSATIIVVPAELTPKEARKFRKDARRRERARGRSEDQVRFVVEGEEPPPERPTAEGGNEDDGDEPRKKKAKKSKSFPRINDLLSQHAAQQKLKEKLAKRTSADDALPPVERGRYVAVDCEMVGVGTDGRKSALARASAVDWDGRVLLDAFVRVPERVTDFRTFVSGVRPRDIAASNESAIEHEECRVQMGKLLKGKIIVGHALKNDLSALMLDHPKEDVRDTARYKPFMRATGRSGGKLRPRKLRDLVREELGRRIQGEGEAHDSVDDARASMDLFRSARVRWEKELTKKKKGGGRGMK